MNESVKINWLNIIYNKEFIQYLEIELLKEISLLSKVVRSKYKPIIFNNIQLISSNFNLKFDIIKINDGNLFIEYFFDLTGSELYCKIPRARRILRKSLTIEHSLNNIIDSLKDIKSFVKSFNLLDVERAGYYLFPMIRIFDNLTTLKLKSCVIPFNGFTEFSNYSQSMLNLRYIDLTFVVLAKSNRDFTSLADFKFPPNLNHLEIYYCEMTITKLLSDPYKFLFDKGARATFNSFTLPKISVPSLKKLVFFENIFQDNGLKDFIEINQDLESLKIESFNPYIIKGLKCLKSFEVDELTSFDNGIQLPTLEYITKLKINSVGLDNYGIVKKLCILCPNLTNLNFNMMHCENFQSSIYNFLIPTLSNLPKLKTLQLCVTTDENENLNITKFSNIELLILETESSTIFNLIFESCNSLKKVEFCSYTREINTIEFREKFNNYKNWKFKFSENIIKGYKYHNTTQ